MALIVGAVSLIVPSINEGDFVFETSTGFALFLTALAAGLSAQVSGE